MDKREFFLLQFWGVVGFLFVCFGFFGFFSVYHQYAAVGSISQPVPERDDISLFPRNLEFINAYAYIRVGSSFLTFLSPYAVQ